MRIFVLLYNSMAHGSNSWCFAEAQVLAIGPGAGHRSRAAVARSVEELCRRCAFSRRAVPKVLVRTIFVEIDVLLCCGCACSRRILRRRRRSAFGCRGWQASAPTVGRAQLVHAARCAHVHVPYVALTAAFCCLAERLTFAM